MSTILIIEDDPLFRETLEDLVSVLGLQPLSAGTLEKGRELALERGCDLALLDLMMPDGNGLDLLPELLHAKCRPEVCIITGLDKEEAARLAFNHGAWDYITKTASLEEIKLSIRRALAHREEKQRHAGADPAQTLRWSGVAGVSPASRSMLQSIATAATSDVSVLITGQTGTGKELAARAIHENSARARSPFVVLDCASLPHTLVESELFGHEKGAFTGASAKKQGMFALAHKGTLFLDEVGELPLTLQPALLRVLQERRYRPVGGREYLESDFRLVAATNKDLQAMAAAGDFRSDLLYRLATLEVQLPPLAERIEDVSQLCVHFLELYCQRNKREPFRMSPEFMEALYAYHWPGNVRELSNAMERAAAAAGILPTLHLLHLPAEIRMNRLGGESGRPAAHAPSLGENAPLPPWAEYKKELEEQAARRYFSELLQQCGGNRKLALERSGLSKSQFYKLLQMAGL